MVKSDKYAQDGVNVVEGDSFSAFAGALCRQTYGNSPYIAVRDFSHGHFRGPRGFRPKGLPRGCWMDLASDGDGTKVVLVDAAGDYDNAAYGWVAMTGGDITRWGGIPLVFVNNLDAATLGKNGEEVNNAFRRMMSGLKRIADEQRFVMFKGETAELSDCIGRANPNARARYLWSGVAWGAYNPDTVITGDQIAPGMVVMALREKGFRNNGASSVRKSFAMKFGPDWAINPEAQDAIKAAAVPAVLYDRFLATANGWYASDFQPLIPAHLIAHITGGGIKSKFFEDILRPRGFSANLNNLWDPPEIMRQCAEWRGLSDEECYSALNGGQGALVVIEKSHVKDFVGLAAGFGIQAQCAGVILKKRKPNITIKSKFSGKTIVWPPK